MASPYHRALRDSSDAARDGVAAAHTAHTAQHEREPLAPGDYSGRLPVDILDMPVVPCPLIKLGNRVIICGRYGDDHPCVRAANNLGVVMLSNAFSTRVPPHTSSREERFLADWRAFHFEIYGLVPKLPTVSGSKLDLFLFAQQILLLGGIHTVIEKRGFVVLAKQLRLTKPCTSAATVLRRAHQSLMHHYENKLMQICGADSFSEPSSRTQNASPPQQHAYQAHKQLHDSELSSPRRKVRRLSEPHAYATAPQSAHSLNYGWRTSSVDATLRTQGSYEEALPRLPPLTTLTSAISSFRSSGAHAGWRYGGGAHGQFDERS